MEETKEERRARKERERAERKKNETEEERRERKERERAERKARETAAAIEAAAHEDLAPAPNKKDEGSSSSNRKKTITTTSTNVAEGASMSAGPQNSTTDTTASQRKHRADETEEERRARKAKERAERKAREAAAAASEQTNATVDVKQRKDGDTTGTREKKKEEESDVSIATKPRERKPTNETEEERRARKARERAERKAREAAAAQDAAKSERDSSAKAPAEEAKEHRHHHHHHSSSPSPSSASRQTKKKGEEEEVGEKKKKPTNESDATAALREAIAAENEAALSRQPSAAAAAGRNNTGRLTSKLVGDVDGTQVSANGTVKSAGGSRPVSRPGLSQVRQASTLSINTTTNVTSVEELRRQAYRSQFVHDCARATALRRLVDLDEVTVGLVDFAPQSAYERYLQQLSAAEAHRTTNTSTEDNEQPTIAIPSQVAVQCPDETMRSDMAVQAIRTRWRSHGLQVPDDLGLYPEGLQDATLTLLRRQRRNANGAEDSEEEDNTVGKEEGEEGDNANKEEDKADKTTTTTTSNTITLLSCFLDRVMPVMEAILDESDALQLAQHSSKSDALQQQGEEGTKAQRTTAFSSLAVSLRCEGLTHYNNNSTSGTLYVRPVRALSYHAASPHLLLALYGPFTTTTTTTTITTDRANGSDMVRVSQYASVVLIWDTRSLRTTTTNSSSNRSKSPTPSSTTVPRHVLASDDVLTCVTSSASRPHLIYAGTASGAVVVWDLRESDRLHESGAFNGSISKNGVGMVPIPHLPSYSSSWLAVDEMGSANSPHTVNNRLSGHTSESEDDDDEYQSNDEEEGRGYYGGSTTTTKMVAPIRKVIVLGHNSVTRAALRDLRTTNTTTTTNNNSIDDSSAMVNDGSNVGGAGGQEEAEQIVSLDASGQLRFWRVQEQPSLRHIVAESDYAMRPFAVVRLHMLSQRHILPDFSTGMDFMSSDGMNMLLSGGMNAAQRMRNTDNSANIEDGDDAYHADDDIDYDDDEDDIFAHRGVMQKMNRHGRHKATRSSPGGYFHNNDNDSEDEGRSHGTRKEVQRWLRLVGGTEAYDVDCLPTDPTHLLVCLPDAVHHVSQFTRYAAPALYKPGTCIDVTALSSGLPLAIPPSTTPFPPTDAKNNITTERHGIAHAGVAAWLPTPRCLTSNAQDSRIWLVGYEDGTVRMYVASESNPVLTIMVSEAPIVQVLPYAAANTTTTTMNSAGNEKEREEGYLVNTSMSSHTGLMADSNTASSPALALGGTTTTNNSTRWLSWALDEVGTVYLLDHAHMNRTVPRLVEPLQAQRESCGKCLCLATPPAMRGSVSESIISATRAGNEKNNSTTTNTNSATSMLALGYERGVVELHIVDHTPWLSNAAERDEQWL